VAAVGVKCFLLNLKDWEKPERLIKRKHTAKEQIFRTIARGEVSELIKLTKKLTFSEATSSKVRANASKFFNVSAPLRAELF
jgi:hypothetical protein